MKNEKETTLVEEHQQSIRLSNPYIIHIKNLTDEKIYDVKLFDYEYEKQNKLKYSCPISSVEYAQILRTLIGENEPRIEIGTIRAIAFCDYAKFKIKQINCEFNIINKDINGSESWIPDRFIIDTYQQQEAISVKSGLKIKFYNKLQIQLAFLMPETEMTIYLFPKSEIKNH